MSLNFNISSLPDFYLVPETRSSISDFKRERPSLQVQLIDEVSNLLCNYCDLPEMKTLAGVHRKITPVSEQDDLWFKVGNILESSNATTKNQTRKFVETTKTQIRELFFESKRVVSVSLQTGRTLCTLKPEMKKELYRLLASEKIEDINRLQQVLKARDALIVWKSLEYNLTFVKNNFNLLDYNSVDDLIKKAEGLEQWCIDNAVALAVFTSLYLEKIDLNGEVLTSLPPQIKFLPNLTELYAQNHQISFLPSEIGECTNLRGLILSNNRLTCLPTEIGKCTKIEQLCLANNGLTCLPLEIEQFTKLEELDLYNNKLQHLSPVIGKLTELKKLKVGNNQLATLPKEIGNLTKLEKLDIGLNPLVSLPKEIKKFSHLPMFYVGQNKLIPLIYRNTVAIDEAFRIATFSVGVLSFSIAITKIISLTFHDYGFYNSNEFSFLLDTLTAGSHVYTTGCLALDIVRIVGIPALDAISNVAYSAIEKVVGQLDRSADLIEDDIVEVL